MDINTRLTRFYTKHCPEKLKDVNHISNKYKNKEKDLFRQLTFKYGPEDLTKSEKKTIQTRLGGINEKKQKVKLVPNWTLDSILDEKDRILLKKIELNKIHPLPKELLDQI
tara:strand:+ start:9366 stop:9698 length:333 start_codon:yes stop_codon:yes gene_type:complete